MGSKKIRLLVPESIVQQKLAQEIDGRFYFSAGFGSIMAKHGLVPGAGSDFGIATRFVPWTTAVAGKPFFFEGPLHPTVLEQMGLAATVSDSDELWLTDAAGRDLGRVVFARALLRRIPVKWEDRRGPYLFNPEDKRWVPERFEYQSFQPGDGDEPLLWARGADGKRELAAVRRGAQIFCGLPLLDVMVQHVTAPPYPDGYWTMHRFSDMEPLEAWLVARMEEMCRRSDRKLVRLGVWPYPFRSAFSVRHDYDRALMGWTRKMSLQKYNILRLLRVYRRYGVKSTWFWRVLSWNALMVRLVRWSGQEVALHTEAGEKEAFRQEVAFFRRTFGLEMAGYTAHGGAGSKGYIGLPQIEWAVEAGYRYGELLGHGNTIPVQAVVVQDDAVRPAPLAMPAVHRGLDVSNKPGGHRLGELLSDAQARLKRGEYCVVMNHPDLHTDALIELIETLDFSGVWHATMHDVANWFLVKASAHRYEHGDKVALRFSEAPSHPTSVYVNGELASVLPAGTRTAEV